jgi:acetyl esterase/lipase
MFRRAAVAIAAAFVCLIAPTVFAQSVFHFDQPSYTTHEGDGQVFIRVVRVGGLSNPATVFLSATCCIGTANYGSDYYFTGSQFNSFLQVSFAANVTFVDVPVTIVDDTFGEGTETAQIALTNGQTAPPDVTTIAILDNDPLPSFLSFDSQTYDVAENAGSVTIGVVRTGDLSGQTSVSYQTFSSSASAGLDFQTTTGTLTFAPNEARKTFSVPIIDDVLAEGNESFFVNIFNPNGSFINASSFSQIVIVDDDPTPALVTIGFASSAFIVDEGAGSATITVKRSGSAAAQASVIYQTANFCCPNATPVVDYTPVAGTLVFAPGETTKTFTVPIIDDTTVESFESFFVSLSSPSGAVLDSNFAQASVTISDNDAPSIIGFQQPNVIVGEADGSVTLTLIRSGDLTKTATVGYSTSDNLARAGQDYTPEAGSVVFQPGETSKTITVPILNDTVPEPTESFNVVINAITNASFATSSATITIVDDDGGTALIGFDQPMYTVNENAGTAQLTVRRTGNTNLSSSVNYSICQFCSSFPLQPATAGLDYLNTAGTLTFAPGETAKTISIQILQDQFIEPAEGFAVQLSGFIGATPVATTAGVTILDDDGLTTAVYAFDPPNVTVREDAGNAILTVVRGNSADAATVRFDALTNTAFAGTDFIGNAGAVAFAAGEARKTISIPILDDSVAEPAETFTARLFSPAGDVIATATVTILDNDGAPSYSINDTSVIEGDSGTRVAVFTVTPSGPAPSSGTSISYQTADETAIAGSDYVATSGTVTWLFGDATPRTVSIIVNGDHEAEDDETFLVKLTGSAALGKSAGRATIVNDDAALSVSDAAPVPEGNSGTKTATFTVTLSPAQTSPVTVNYMTITGTAGEADYIPVAGSLTFAPGETKKTVDVQVNGDTVPEGDETFSLRLTSATGAAIFKGTANATIVDDDDFFTVTRDIEYASADGVSLKLDLYTPNGSTGPFPLVIWIHGDHWSDGVRSPAPAVREASRGYAVAAIDLRSTDVDIFPAQINDAKAAVRYLRANAARYNLDSTRFAVWGFGSGGHIASLLGTAGDIDALSDPAEGNPAISSRVQAVVSWAAPYDLPQLQNDALACSTINHNSSGSFTSIFLGCPLEFCGAKAWDASPGKYATKDDPPFLLIHADDDCEVGPAQAQSFARVLKAAKIDVTLKTIHNFGHLVPTSIAPAATLTDVDAFLDAKLPAPPRRRSASH